MYSPEHSLNGAKLLAGKANIKKPTIESMSTAVLQPQIITPHALPMFRDGDDGRSVKRKREKERMDPRKSKRPDLPVTGPGKGGRVGASATQHVVQNLFRDTTRDQDVSCRVLNVLSDGRRTDESVRAGVYDFKILASASTQSVSKTEFCEIKRSVGVGCSKSGSGHLQFRASLFLTFFPFIPYIHARNRQHGLMRDRVFASLHLIFIYSPLWPLFFSFPDFPFSIFDH